MRINFLLLLFQCRHHTPAPCPNLFATIETEFYLINFFFSSSTKFSNGGEKSVEIQFVFGRGRKKSYEKFLSIFICFPHHKIEALKILFGIIIINNDSINLSAWSARDLIKKVRNKIFYRF